MQQPVNSLKGVTNTHQTKKSISLNAKTLNTFLTNPAEEKITAQINFINYQDVGLTITGLIKTVQYALSSYNENEDLLKELSVYEINSVLAIATQLIPQDELQFIDEIKLKFNGNE